MKILYINQPWNNRGDEAAHKALIRKMVKTLDAEIDVLITWGKKETIDQFKVSDTKVRYFFFRPRHRRYYTRIALGGLRRNMKFLWYFHPDTRRLLKLYKKYDLVFNSPGGISLGGFQNWNHLFLLHVAKYLKKPIAYYGRSFGPFPISNAIERRYTELCYSVLRYFSFLSIRDKKTEKLAQELKINYVPTLDCAFLEQPRVKLPADIKNLIGEDYVVFVPNLLVWHYNYRNRVEKSLVLAFFEKIGYKLLEHYPSSKIVMLPQTFNYDNPKENDRNFFLEIAQRISSDRIVVLSDQYSSDIQQTIISSSKCVAGARYHSIVFAINNCVPFVALSYEHKIAGLLETLGKEDNMIDIVNTFDNMDSVDETVRNIENKLAIVHADTNAQKTAKKFAEFSYNKFLDYLNNL